MPSVHFTDHWKNYVLLHTALNPILQVPIPKRPQSSQEIAPISPSQKDPCNPPWALLVT